MFMLKGKPTFRFTQVMSIEEMVVCVLFRYLTVREQKLRQRRIEAERLLAWKNRLDREEEEVVQLEMEAARKLPQKRDASGEM